MKRIKMLGIFLAMTCALALSACTQSPEPVNTTPYADDGMAYTYIWTEERDRAWEEDVVWFADEFLNFLHGHPYLTDRNTKVISFLKTDGYYPTNSMENFYDPELREKFVARVNQLIVQIPELSDNEILFELNSIVALLDDVHSSISIPWVNWFPGWYRVIFDGEGGYQCYVTVVPEGEETALGCELLAINGVTVTELVELVGEVKPHETEEYLISGALDGYWAFINNCDLLVYLGVVEEGASTAVFTLRDGEGNEFELERRAFSLEEPAGVSLTRSEAHELDWLMNANMDETLWLEYLEENDAIYVRMSKVEYYSVNELPKLVGEVLTEKEQVAKLILDLRGNSGGSADFQSLAWWVNDLEQVGTVYVLIDSRSGSAAVGLPSLLKQAMNDVVLVGMDAAQKPFTPTSASNWTTSPNENITMLQSYLAYRFWPGYEGDALAPDWYVYQTWEDYLNGVDTVLEAVLNDQR